MHSKSANGVMARQDVQNSANPVDQLFKEDACGQATGSSNGQPLARASSPLLLLAHPDPRGKGQRKGEQEPQKVLAAFIHKLFSAHWVCLHKVDSHGLVADATTSMQCINLHQ